MNISKTWRNKVKLAVVAGMFAVFAPSMFVAYGEAGDTCSADKVGQCGTAGGCQVTMRRCSSTDNGLGDLTYYCMTPEESSCTCGDTTCNPSTHKCGLSTGACVPLSGTSEPGTLPAPKAYSGKVIEAGDLAGMIGMATNILYYGGLLIGILSLIYAGYLFITSAGDPRSTDEAKEVLTAAVIGIIFILLTRVIITTVLKQTLGV